MRTYRVTIKTVDGKRLVGVEKGKNLAEVRHSLNCDSRVKSIVSIIPESKWKEVEPK